MTAVEHLVTGDMQDLARKHLWMHFTPMGGYDAAHEVPDHRHAARAATSSTSTAAASSTGCPRCTA